MLADVNDAWRLSASTARRQFCIGLSGASIPNEPDTTAQGDTPSGRALLNGERPRCISTLAAACSHVGGREGADARRSGRRTGVHAARQLGNNFRRVASPRLLAADPDRSIFQIGLANAPARNGTCVRSPNNTAPNRRQAIVGVTAPARFPGPNYTSASPLTSSDPHPRRGHDAQAASRYVRGSCVRHAEPQQ